MLQLREQMGFKVESSPTYRLPDVDGFTKYSEFGVTDANVSQCLWRLFGTSRLAEAKVSKVSKRNDFLIFIPENASTKFKSIINDFVELGLLQSRTKNVLSARNRSDYETVERDLEGKCSADTLNHTYKARATAGELDKPSAIDLHSFSTDTLESFDYLQDLPFSPTEKMKIYLLGTVVHEVMHRLEQASSVGSAIRAEITGGNYKQWRAKEKFSSQYVARHALDFGSSPETVLAEEVAELVRIFVTNPLWMLSHNEEGFRLVNKYFDFFIPGILQSIAADAEY